jgi:acetylornithine deacetylase/succinyl-diaminopimelate desuccinylase-like protein
VPDNAIYDLAAALDRLSRLELPARLGAGPRGYAARLLPSRSGAAADALRAVLDGTASGPQLKVLSEDASFNAQLRTTCVATMLEGGHAANALPQRARATVNCRLLPGEDAAFVQRELEKAAGPRVKVTARAKGNPSAETSAESHAMKIIEREALATWPGISVSTVMSAGATDGSRLRNAGIPVYGLLPMFMAASDWQRMHGRDERIPAKAFEEALGYLHRVVRALAGP